MGGVGGRDVCIWELRWIKGTEFCMYGNNIHPSVLYVHDND